MPEAERGGNADALSQDDRDGGEVLSSADGETDCVRDDDRPTDDDCCPDDDLRPDGYPHRGGYLQRDGCQHPDDAPEPERSLHRVDCRVRVYCRERVYCPFQDADECLSLTRGGLMCLSQVWDACFRYRHSDGNCRDGRSMVCWTACWMCLHRDDRYVRGQSNDCGCRPDVPILFYARCGCRYHEHRDCAEHRLPGRP